MEGGTSIKFVFPVQDNGIFIFQFAFLFHMSVKCRVLEKKRMPSVPEVFVVSIFSSTSLL